jgi:hypothetical protein
MARERRAQPLFSRSARRTDRGEDAAAGGVQLLVARARRSRCELLDSISGEAGVGVTVDEARNRREPAAVELLDGVAEPRKLAHRADLRDATVLAEHEPVFDDVQLSECRPSERRRSTRWSRDLGQVTDQESGRRRLFRHVPPPGTDGRSSPLARAVSSASS